MVIMLSVFTQILLSSGMAVILAGLILSVRKLCRSRFDARWQHCIWFLLLIKLLVPYTPEIPVSIPNSVTAAVQKVPFVDKLMLLASDGIQLDEYSLKFDENENSQNNTDKSTKQSDIAEPKVAVSGDLVAVPVSNDDADKNYSDTIMTLFKIWAAGCVLLICYTTCINIRFIRQIRNCYYCDDQRVNDIHKECMKKTNIKRTIPLFIAIHSTTPALYGILKPRILISEKYMNLLKDDEIKYILLHELFHYKRKDIMVNWLMVVLQIIHWFNPVVWYCFHLMREDCELACDEKVLTCIEPDERKKYGQTIINLVKEVNESCYIPSTAGFMKKSSSVKRRIMMISRFRKKSWLRAVAAAVLIITLGLVGIPGYKSMAADDERVTFESEQLEAAVKESLRKSKDSIIYESDLKKVKELDLLETTDIKEIKNCTNLEALTLRKPLDLKIVNSLKNLKNLKEVAIFELKGNSNMSELGVLPQLETLGFYNCSDLSSLDKIALMPNIKKLSIYERSKLTNDSMRDLSKMRVLKTLFVENIPVTSLEPLEKLTDLEALAVMNGYVKDISPLKNLTKIEHLNLAYERITDISPLSGMKNLNYLEMNGNRIEDLSPLADKKELETVWLKENQISDISPLTGSKKIKILSLGKNKINDIKALVELTKLEDLYLSDNQISDLSALSGLTKLKRLDLEDNKVTDIKALAGLTQIEYLILNSNQISDLTPLNKLTNLKNLGLSNNKITDVKSLAGLTQLKGGLWLKPGNNIKDFSPIAEFYKPEDEK